nr:peptide chain release factor class A (=1), fragment [uncultured bacterium]
MFLHENQLTTKVRFRQCDLTFSAPVPTWYNVGTMKNSGLNPKQLRRRMEQLGIREPDLEERFVRSRGPGGQNINKVSTCVYLKHRTSGIEIKCQSQRTQSANRIAARALLVSKIEQEAAALSQRQKKQRFLIERARRTRTISAKKKVRENKERKSQKKSLRRRLSGYDEL